MRACLYTRVQAHMCTIAPCTHAFGNVREQVDGGGGRLCTDLCWSFLKCLADGMEGESLE